ncbi:MAG: carboxylating nicotinate-nucleotide diphosphorylase [Bacteroidia bacterium]|nr:carboxylating nicotinate-nucleotide diphosphorylase [Bacteroidia bacterium]
MHDLDNLLKAALEEDLGTLGDITSQAVQASNRVAVGRCIVKKTGILAGIQIAREVYRFIDNSVIFHEHFQDGALCEAGEVAFEVYGNAYTLLVAERLILNLMQRLSGIATLTRQYVEVLKGTNCEVLDTRKTTPLWRRLEKWAVTLGGGKNHRHGLYDQFLIKDNHIDLVGGVAPAIEAVLSYKETHRIPAPIVVEVRNLAEIHQALSYAPHIDRLLLDNLTPEQVARAVEYIGGRLPVEVSGGITPENARAYAEAGARYISAGTLTHSAPALDISFKMRPMRS